MGDITRQDQEKMLDLCYVENRELTEFSRDLQQILQYDATLDELEIPIDEVDKSLLEKELEFQSATSKPKTILLVGNVGAGKSTFIHRFSRNEARTRRNICTIVDLINHSTKEIERGRAEEQRLAELVINRLAIEFQEKVDPYNSDILRGCFEVELNRFKKQRQMLLSLDPNKYAFEEEAYLYEQSKDKYKHLVGYLKYVRKKRYRVWIAFDNVDRGSDSYQSFVYAFAHQLSSDAGCVTLITLRQDTFLEAQDAGFLDVRSSDIIFQITAPEFRQVISKRRKYIDQIIARNEVPKPFKAHVELIQILNWHLTRLVLEENNFVRLLITTLSLNNIRYGLQMLRDYYTSYHCTFHEFYKEYPNIVDINEDIKLDYKLESSRFLQALMLSNCWVYQEENTEIFNVFWVSPLEKTSHFLMLRILAYLSIERNVNSARISVKYEKVCNDFISLGFQRHHINIAIRRLLYAGLIVSPNLPDNPATEAKMDVPETLPREMKIAISGRGHYYLKTLASHEYYQTRVGEDTIWYNSEDANLYIKCIQESLQAQHPGSYDMLQVTSAREIFLDYLKKSLLEEVQSNLRFSSAEWVRIMYDIVERSIFGETITKPIYIDEKEAFTMIKELLKETLNSLDEIETKSTNKKSGK